MKPSHSLIRRAVASGAALLLSFVLNGCNRQSGLVGKWSGSDPALAKAIGSSTAVAVYDFHNDGLYEVSEKTDKRASTSSTPMASLLFGDATNIHISGSYTVKDDVLTLTPKSLTLADDKGQPPSFTPNFKQDPQTNRYKIAGAALTLDRMDGDKPLVLSRQEDAE